jgi:hypothetical protein
MQIADRCAPVKVANNAENSDLQALQFHKMSVRRKLPGGTARLVPSLYDVGTDRRENAASNNFRSVWFRTFVDWFLIFIGKFAFTLLNPDVNRSRIQRSVRLGLVG